MRCPQRGALIDRRKQGGVSSQQVGRSEAVSVAGDMTPQRGEREDLDPLGPLAKHYQFKPFLSPFLLTIPSPSGPSGL
jgi:hypothetical protein